MVIGGAGKLGRWFAEFLLSQGFAVEVADPAGAPEGTVALADWQHADLGHDFIVVATPLGYTDKVLRDLAMRRPAGVIFDLGSLKSPLRGGLMDRAKRETSPREVRTQPGTTGPRSHRTRHVRAISCAAAGEEEIASEATA